MDKLIKALFRKRDRDLVVMIVDRSDLGEPEEIRLRSSQQVRWFTAIIIGSVVVGVSLVALLLSRFVTGGDARTRAELNQLANRVGALSDSVEIRDLQLRQIRATLSGGGERVADLSAQQRTVATASGNGRGAVETEAPEAVEIVFPSEWSRATRSMTGRPVLRGGTSVVQDGGIFPARLPVSGRITRSYMPESGHFGTDVAVREGTVLRNIARGTVVGSDWTIPYGFVVTIMHEDGHVLIYKHLVESSVQAGDVVQRGDQLGVVGMAGTLSSGPHLHVELWKNGSHIDPMLYFVE